MTNFNLTKLADYKAKIFTDADIKRYVSPIEEIVKRNRLPLKFDDCYDNVSMLRIDLEPINIDVELDKMLKYFNPLKNLHQKFFSKVNGNRVSIYIPKIDVDKGILSLKRLLDSDDYFEYINSKPRELPFVLGETVENKVIIEDLAKLPHLLIAGASGSGKSVTLHAVLTSLLYKLPPEDLKLSMFDMKMVELAFYEELPHLLHPICDDSDEAPKLLKQIVNEMKHRLNLMKQNRVLTLSRYNKIKNIEKLPYLVVVIDEVADLIMSNKSAEKIIATIAQKGRAAGIHLILATQRPDATVLTGQIKSNIQARVALAVSSHYESQIILDQNGAELLSMKGDMLYRGNEGTYRLQGAFLDENDVDKATKMITEKLGTNNLEIPTETIIETETTDFKPIVNVKKKNKDGDIIDGKMVLLDEFYHSCTAVIGNEKASKTYLKTILRCGDRKANRYLDRMNKLGVIDKYDKVLHGYPILAKLKDFENKFITEAEANG